MADYQEEFGVMGTGEPLAEQSVGERIAAEHLPRRVASFSIQRPRLADAINKAIAEAREEGRRYRQQIADERGEFTGGRTIAQLEEALAAKEAECAAYRASLIAARTAICNEQCGDEHDEECVSIRKLLDDSNAGEALLARLKAAEEWRDSIIEAKLRAAEAESATLRIELRTTARVGIEWMEKAQAAEEKMAALDGADELFKEFKITVKEALAHRRSGPGTESAVEYWESQARIRWAIAGQAAGRWLAAIEAARAKEPSDEL